MVQALPRRLGSKSPFPEFRKPIYGNCESRPVIDVNHLEPATEYAVSN